jgi:hypothetical protein
MDLRDAGVPEWAASIIANGSSDRDASAIPAIGELWTLTWDAKFAGAVVISGVFEHHVLGIPVNDHSPSQSEASISALGIELSAWPQAETGLGSFLLHHRLCGALREEQVVEIKRWEAGAEDLVTLQAGSGTKDAQVFHEILQQFQRLCFIEWPSSAEATLNVDALDMSAIDFAKRTGLSSAQVLSLWTGLPPSDEEMKALGANASSWLSVMPDAATTELSAPSVKGLIVELAILRDLDERSVRNQARSAFALAARTDSAVRRDISRAADTVMNLLEEARAARDHQP